MIAEKYHFEKLDTEKESRFLEKGEYIYLRNGISVETDQNSKGSVQNIIGNRQVAYTFSSGGLVVGEYEDKEKNRTVFFRYATDDNHGIYELDDTDTVVKIIEWSGLNFTPNTRVEGIAILDEMLVWCDDTENIRKINIERGKVSNTLIQESFSGAGTQSLDTTQMVASEYILRTNNDNGGSTNSITISVGTEGISFDIPAGASQDYKFNWNGTDTISVMHSTSATFTIRESLGYPLPLEEEFITLMKRPPALPLQVAKVEDTTYANNFIRDKAFQFYYRYIYDDDEPSVFSATSKLINKSIKDDDPDNGIDIKIDFLEEIPSTVKKIEYAYRQGNGAEWVIFDADERLSNGTFNRQKTFYGDTFGETIADQDSFKWFDSVPKSAKALEIIRNRIFFFNYLEGYKKTPSSIELSLGQLDTGATLLDQALYRRTKLRWEADVFSCTEINIHQPFGYFVVIDGLYYEVDFNAPTNEAWVKSGEEGSTLAQITTGIDTVQSLPCENDPQATVRSGDEHSIAIDIPNGITVYTNSPTQQGVFKTESSYRVAKMYHDESGRHIGVHLSPIPSQNKISIDSFTLPLQVVDQTIIWDVSNTPTSEIPDWATHFSIVRTSNLTKTYFIQHESADLWYYRENEPGDLTYQRGTFDPTYDGVLVDISNLTNVTLGYTFQEGDRLRIWDLNSRDWDVVVKRQEGKFIFIDIIDIGTLPTITPVSVRYELYTPYTKFTDETYYEIGEKYIINNAGTPSKAFSKLTGTLKGDVTYLQRDVYTYKTAGYLQDDPYANELDATPTSEIFEAMSTRDDSFNDWVTDVGRGSPVVKLAKELRKANHVRHSREYIQDGSLNELSTFDALDEYPLPKESGAGTKLVRAENVLIGFHERNTTAIYVGEEFINTRDSNNFLAKSEGVIGDDRKYLGEYGTIYPESVAVYNDTVYFWDIFKGEICRRTREGIFPISRYGMKTYFYNLSRQYLPYKDSIKVIGGYDPFYDTYVVTFPAVGTLTGETWWFHEPSNRWVGNLDYLGIDRFSRLLKRLVSFKDGNVWIHDNTDTYNNFFGVQYERELRFDAVPAGSKVKIWSNIRLDADSISRVDIDEVIVELYVNGQFTDVYDFNLKEVEGVFTGAIYRDRNTPGFENPDEAKYKGEVMRGQVGEFRIYNRRSDASPMHFVTLLFRVSEVSFV